MSDEGTKAAGDNGRVREVLDAFKSYLNGDEGADEAVESLTDGEQMAFTMGVSAGVMDEHERRNSDNDEEVGP